MATSTRDDRDSDVGQGKPLSPAEQAEFDQLSRQLQDTPAGDSDLPYDPQAGSTAGTPITGGHRMGSGPTAGRPGRVERTPTSESAADPSESQAGGRGPSAIRPQMHRQSGIANPDSAIQRGGLGSTKKELGSDEIKDQEDQLGKGYTSGQQEDGDDPKLGRGARGYFKRYRKQIFAIGGFVGTITGVAAFMMTLMPWQLHNLLHNIDAHTFARLQGIDMRDRSSKWIKAYMTARLLDIDEGPNSKKMSENILFRSDRVDYNKPLTDWYRTIRATKFEHDMFEKHGIRFTSSAVREGNKIVIRPAKITIGDTTALEFNLRAEGIDENTIQAALKGDIKAFEAIDRATGKLDQLVKIEFFDEKTGRKELRKAINQMLKVNGWNWWNAFKRYHMRKAIQNMTGIRSWRFFETTREKWREKALSARNKMLEKALPTNTKSGKFLACMFGIESCKTRPDPLAPDNRNLPNNGGNGSGRTDSEGNPLGDGRDELRPGLNPGGEGSFAKKITSEIIKKGSIAVSIVSFINSLSKFDENVTNHSLSQIVQTARGQQVAGLYTMIAVANDQLPTDEVVGDEVDDTMGMIADATNTEFWETVVNERPNVVKAQAKQDDFVSATNKKQYCSAEFQEKLRKPVNAVHASNEFGYLCPQDTVGVTATVSAFEDGWNNGVGVVLHPILVVWRNSIGVIAELFEDIVNAITQPVVEAVLKALGLSDDIKELAGWIGQKVLEFSGAGPMWDELTPSTRIVNLIGQGGAYVAEGAASAVGAALTTQQMEQESLQAYRKNQAEKYAESSFTERYLSLENPESVASNTLFAILNRSPQTYGQGLLSSLGGILSLPFSVLSKTVSAATPGLGDPYTAARLAHIPTFDFPKKECLDREVIGDQPPLISPGVWGQNGDGSQDGMTPQNATNADEEGVFKPEELTWDLIRNSDAWKEEVYSRVGDDNAKAMRIYNCALLDNAVAGALGGTYGYQGVGALSSEQYKKE